MGLVHGIDANAAMYPLLVDASGRALVVANGQEAGGTITPILVDAAGHVQADVLTLPAIPAGSNEIGAVQARAYGYIGGAWQKNPLQWGYYGQVLQSVENRNLAAGVNNLDTAAVPANTIWVLTSLAVAYAGTIGGVSLFVSIYDGVTTYNLFSEAHVVTGEYLDRQGTWVLKAGDVIRYTIAGATLNDDGFLKATGYYMTLNL